MKPSSRIRRNRADGDSWLAAVIIATLIRLHELDQYPEKLARLNFDIEINDVLLEIMHRVDADSLAEITHELLYRFETVVRERNLQNFRSVVEGIAKDFVASAAMSRMPIQQVLDFLGRFRSEDLRGVIFESYVESLLSTRQPSNAFAAIDTYPNSNERKEDLKDKVAHALFLSSTVYTSADLGSGLWGQLHRRVVQQEHGPVQYRWPKREELPSSIPKFQDEQRAILSGGFFRVWLNTFLAGVAGDRSGVDAWISDLRPHGWTDRTAICLANVGFLMGRSLLAVGSDLCAHLASLDDVDEITPGDPSWEDWELWTSYKKALRSIVIECLALRSTYQKKRIDDAALAFIQAIRGLQEHDQYQLLLGCRQELLEEQPIVTFVGLRLTALRTRLEEFPERAQAYLDVATLTRRAGASSLSREALRNAIENLLG
jgi:hypothetical protein